MYFFSLENKNLFKNQKSQKEPFKETLFVSNLVCVSRRYPFTFQDKQCRKV